MIEQFRSRKNRQYYFRVRSRNRRIIAQSEGYKSKRSCDRGIQALLRVARGDYQIVDRGWAK